jgi:hypothetical protein
VRRKERFIVIISPGSLSLVLLSSAIALKMLPVVLFAGSYGVKWYSAIKVNFSIDTLSPIAAILKQNIYFHPLL